MKTKSKFLKTILILSLGMCIVYIMCTSKDFFIFEKLQNNINRGLKTVNITNDKYKFNYRDLSLNITMPVIHYQNEEVQRYINSYLRKSINEYVNEQKQCSDLNHIESKSSITITYNVVYESKDILNIVINRDIRNKNHKYNFSKDSFVFDLKTGQRIFIDNFLDENEDYRKIIQEYIRSKSKNKKKLIDIKDINIDKYTNYSITDEGINIFFNPYKCSDSNINYEFNIPYELFKKSDHIVKSNNIIANVDTQTITTNDSFFNSIVNIPIIMSSNKVIMKSINDKIRNDIMNDYNNFKKDSDDYLINNANPGFKFVYNTDYEVKKNSNNLLSILVSYYKYSGGAHGYSENIAYNIDIRNGHILNLNDLFKINSNYSEVINKEIMKQLEKKSKEDPENSIIGEFKGIKKNQKFYIQDNNLVVYFDLYDIAPYAAGIPEFSINKSIINHIIRDEYVQMFN